MLGPLLEGEGWNEPPEKQEQVEAWLTPMREVKELNQVVVRIRESHARVFEAWKGELGVGHVSFVGVDESKCGDW